MKSIKKKKNAENKRGWVPATTKSYGNYFVFAGVLFIFFSRVLLLFSKHFLFGLAIFFLLPVAPVVANEIERTATLRKILSGNGSKKNFLDYAHILIAEEKVKEAEIIYEENKSNLDKYERVNLGTLNI